MWKSPGTDVVGPPSVRQGLESLMLLFPLWLLRLAPSCPARPLLWGGQKGVSEPHLPTGTEVPRGTMPSLLPGPSLTQLCPSSSLSGSNTEAGVAQFSL